MSAISQNSITGISSITAQNEALSFYRSNGGNGCLIGISTIGIGTNVIPSSSSLEVSGFSVPVAVNSTNSNAYKIQFRDAGITTSNIGAGNGSLFSVGTPAGVERLRLSTAGYFQCTQQPYASTQQVTVASRTVTGNNYTTLIPLSGNINQSDGNHLDTATGIFTFPVTGRYLITYGSQGKTSANISTGFISYSLNGSGNGFGQCLFYGEAYSGNSETIIISVSANDTIRFELYGANNIGYTVNGAHYAVMLVS